MAKPAYQIVTEQVHEFRNEMNERFDKLECNFVTRKEFEPVKSIAYGLITIIVLTVMGAILASVIKAAI